jgi:hypothetical protein
MDRIDRLNLAQRIVVVVALAAALDTIGELVTNFGRHLDGGWFGYAANAPLMTLPNEGLRPGLAAVVWLVLILVWMLCALRLFRSAETAE